MPFLLKCFYRNTDRNVVLAHVKEHYVNGSQNRNDSSRTANDGDLSSSLPEVNFIYKHTGHWF